MARRTSEPLPPHTSADSGQAADPAPDEAPEWPDAATLKGLRNITHIREQCKDDPIKVWRWAGGLYGPGVAELDNHPALPVIRHCCRQLFAGQTLADALDALYDRLVTEKGMTKAAADGMRVDELADLLRHGDTPGGGVQLDEDDPTLPEFMSVAHLARIVVDTVPAVDAFLRRYRVKHRDCYETLPAPRRNEHRVVYRTRDVLPILRARKRRPS
jgi:hypothetical protein